MELTGHSQAQDLHRSDSQYAALSLFRARFPDPLELVYLFYSCHENQIEVLEVYLLFIYINY